MKHEQNSRMRGTSNLLRYYFISALMLLCIFAANAHASGAKLPTVGEEVITDTSGTVDVDVEEETTEEPKAPTTGQTPAPAPTTPTPLPGGTTPPISDDYSHLDPDKIVPKSRLSKALKYFDDNKSKIKNQDVIAVIDFSQHSSKERFYLIDMNSGRVETFATAHGKGSDSDHNGYAEKFSNVSGSQASSQGIYIAAETYQGSNGYSMKLDGKSSTNSNARSRSVVIHPADYVVSGQKAGRSWGCPALNPRESAYVIDQLKNGAVIYAE